MNRILNFSSFRTLLIITAVLLASVFSFTYAAEPLDCQGLKIATGPAGKGYSKLYSDIKSVAGTVPLCEINTHGGLDNLNALSTNKADIGIVQLDTLKDMAAGDENIALLQAIMPLNSNFLHVLTSVNGYVIPGDKKWLGLSKKEDTSIQITKFSDLKGHNVALVGTAQLWARKLNKQLGYNMTFIDVDSDAKAMDMARKGQVFAVMTVGGWPHGFIDKLKSDNGLTLIAYDAPSIPPYIVRNLNYKGLGVYNSPSLGVQNVLVTRPFREPKITAVSTLRNIIAKNIVELQDGSYEPAWKEVKNIDAPVDWTRFKK